MPRVVAVDGSEQDVDFLTERVPEISDQWLTQTGARQKYAYAIESHEPLSLPRFALVKDRMKGL